MIASAFVSHEVALLYDIMCFDLVAYKLLVLPKQQHPRLQTS
jgi:hypothetical protein